MDGRVVTDWNYDMAAAPKDRPILAWCRHDADPYFIREESRLAPLFGYRMTKPGDRLTVYGQHVEGIGGGGHAKDGLNVLVWGGSYTETDEYGAVVANDPDWWFLDNDDFDIPANPIAWADAQPAEACGLIMTMTKVDLTPRICSDCGKDARRSYYPCPELDRMIRDDLCYECAFWSVSAEKKHETVIDHVTYTPGNRLPNRYRVEPLGCAGRRFDIEYFDGRKITTFDVWVGGPIPERYWDRIPDTAKFLNGGSAARDQSGEVYAFNHTTKHDAPLNPLPNGKKIKYKQED